MTQINRHPLGLIERNCFGIVVHQEKNNGYINITKLAKAYQQQAGKRREASEWLSNKRTQESIEHLSSVTGIPVTGLTEVIQGGSAESQGTFVHPKLALRFGIWLSDEFGYLVEQWFEEWVSSQNEQKSTQPESETSEAAFILDIAAKSAINAGVDPEIAEQLRLDGLAKLFPKYQDVLLMQKNAIAASKPLPELPKTPTEIGQELAARLGYVKVSAKKVNSKLLELGYQISVTRTKKSNGKEVHHYYQPTEKAKNHSQLQMTAYVQGEGKSTKPQLRWFSSIVTILANNWEDSHE